MTRIAVFCPGRGSYTEATLRSVDESHEWTARAEELRRAAGLESLLDLDRARRFEPGRHLRPSNVSALIYLTSMIDGAQVLERERAVCIGGNSLGWYTALALGGALSFEDGFRLVQTMSTLQEDAGGGGQILYPLVDADWRASSEHTARVEATLAGSNGEALLSIHLGGFAVLAGSEAGITHLMRGLPKVTLGRMTYPFRLAQHGPYHTPLVAPVAARARRELEGMVFKAPRVTLLDGRGARFTPWSADVGVLRDYTLGDQVITPFNFSASVRVALREYAPDRLVLLRPGNTLGGICGQVLVSEGWRGVHSRADFEVMQEGSAPLIDSRGRRPESG